MTNGVRVVRARTQVEQAAALALITEYAKWLADAHGVSLDFQNFDQEVADLAAAYPPPAGDLLLGLSGEGVALGVIGFRPFRDTTCEIKRLYVRPAARGLGLGRRLISAVLETATEAGYQRAILDTADFMPEAQALYVSFGFRDIDAYYHNPIACSRFLERALTGSPS